MIKTLHIVKTSTGAAWALQQMRELVRHGVEVHVAMPSNGPLVAEYQRANIHIHSLETDFPLKSPWLLRERLSKFRNLVIDLRPDIIHSHFVGTTLLMRFALRDDFDIPRVFQVPGPLHLENKFFGTREIATANGLDFWIGSCKWTCNKYREAGISKERIFLSYYGTNVEKFENTIPGTLRHELNLHETDTIIGMVAYFYAPKRLLGQVRGLKGHEDLLDALSICIQKNRNIYGVFAGGAWNGATRYEQQVRAYGKRKCNDHAVFLGTRSDIAAIYSDVNVAVHPSLSENVGGAVESLLLGVPTIATNVGGFPDLVINGETGWLVPPRSPYRLADAILSVLDDPKSAQELALNGKALARQLFDVKRTAREVFDIYMQVIHSG